MSHSLTHQIHDKFFRGMMTEPGMPESFLKHYLPQDISSKVNWKKIKLLPKTFLKNTNKELIADCVFRVSLNEQPAYVSVLIEHQSKPDKLMPLRILNYSVEVMNYHLKQEKNLPLVYPLIFYNGRTPYCYSLDLAELIEAPMELVKRYFLKPAQLIDLTQQTKESLVESGLAGVLGLSMGHHYLITEIMPDVIKLMRQHNFPVPENVLKYLIETKTYEQSELESVLKHVGDEQMTESYQNLVASFEARGRRAGLYEGMEEGRQEGLQAGRQEGLQAGREKECLNIAKLLLKEGQSIEFVMKITGLSREEIEALQDTL